MVQTLYILLAYVVFATVFARLRLGTVVGLLLAGAAIGPYGARLIEDVDAVATLAELGVVFLLFNLGLEMKLERMRVFGARVYVLAVTQVCVTSAVVAVIAHRFGLGIEASIVVGGALALSSTAVVLQVLSDLGRTLTHLGRLAIATLLVQDLAVGPLLIAANILGGGYGNDQSIGTLALGAVGAVVVVVAGVRIVLPMVLRQVSAVGAPELFLGVLLLVVLAASWATEHAGLSAGVGAFLAGLMVADTEYRHQIAADIAPFRGILLGLFFMTVGMRTDLGSAVDQAATVAAITAALVLGKALLLIAPALLLGYGLRLSIQFSILLSQGSEFSLVVLGVALTTGMIDGPIANALTIAVALSMLVAPLAAATGRNLLDRLEGEAASSPSRLDVETADLVDHVLVVGFGQVGVALTRHLLGLGIPVVVLDYDSQRVRLAQRRGLPVFFGNATRSDVLRAVHIDRARLVMVVLPDADVSGRVISLVRRLAPGISVIARAPDADDAPALQRAGADAIVPDGLTTAVDLAERAILSLNPGGTETHRPRTKTE